MDRLRIIEFVPAAVQALARGLGYFEDASVSVETARTRSAPEQRDRLLAGEFDAGTTAIDNLIAWNADGADFVLVAQLERTTVLDLVARVGIASLADLAGARFAVDSPVTGFSIVLRAMFARHGIRIDDDQLVAAGGIGQRFEAIRDGDADAGLLGPPWSQQAAESGLVHLTTVEAEFPDFPGIGLVVRRVQVERVRPVLGAYLRACSTAAAWACHPTHRGAALGILADAGFPPQGAESILAVVPCSIEPAMNGVRLLYEMRRALGRLPAAAPGPAALVDGALLAAAIGESKRVDRANAP
ncbi:MAG TPA: ABC transporter substrate-binding protein [Solirubrobacteraceae bacterium]|jgi:ABC-type nitrate/sulfonate/bicarbonate transport system substrate-binding protein